MRRWHLIFFVLYVSCSVYAQAVQFDEKWKALVENSLVTGITDQHIGNSGTTYLVLESQFKESLEADPHKTGEVPTKSRELARIYLENGRAQEAVWVLEEGAQYALAQEIAQRIEAALSEAPVKIIGPLKKNGGMVDPLLDSLIGKIAGLDVILKPQDPEAKLSIEAEVWNYQIDRTFGINLVPATVKRKTEKGTYSAQLFIKGARNSNFNFRDDGYVQKYSRIYFLDYITWQRDRHGQNSMFNPGGRFFAIDSGRCEGAFPEIKPTAEYRERVNLSSIPFNYRHEIQPDADLLANLHRLQGDTLPSHLAPLIDSRLSHFMSGRINNIKLQFPNYDHKIKVRSLTPLERMTNQDSLGISPEELKVREQKRLKQNTEILENEINQLMADKNKTEVDGETFSQKFKSLYGRFESIEFKIKSALFLKLLLSAHESRIIPDYLFSSLYLFTLEFPVSESFKDISRIYVRKNKVLSGILSSDYKTKYEIMASLNKKNEKNLIEVIASLSMPGTSSCGNLFN